MSFFNRASDWEINALVIISAQLKDIQRKLDALLAATPEVPAKQFDELQQESEKLKAKADLLAHTIEKQKKG